VDGLADEKESEKTFKDTKRRVERRRKRRNDTEEGNVRSAPPPQRKRDDENEHKVRHRKGKRKMSANAFSMVVSEASNSLLPSICPS